VYVCVSWFSEAPAISISGLSHQLLLRGNTSRNLSNPEHFYFNKCFLRRVF